MSKGLNQRAILTAAFEELTYAVAGVVASHAISDDAVWDLARIIDHVHRKAHARLFANRSTQDQHGQTEDTLEHPAIMRLLRQLRPDGTSLPGESAP